MKNLFEKKNKQRKAHKIGGGIPFDFSDTTTSPNFSESSSENATSS